MGTHTHTHHHHHCVTDPRIDEVLQLLRCLMETPPDPRIAEVMRLLRRLDRKDESIMATFREMLREELNRLVVEVQETRTASEAVAVAIVGLRDQLNNAVEEGDIEAVRSVIAGLDEVQARLVQAAGENIDPGVEPDPVPEPTPDPVPEPTPAPPVDEPPPEGGGGEPEPVPEPAPDEPLPQGRRGRG